MGATIIRCACALVLLGAGVTCFSEPDAPASSESEQGDATGPSSACDGQSCAMCRVCVVASGGPCETDAMECTVRDAVCTTLDQCAEACGGPGCVAGCCSDAGVTASQARFDTYRLCQLDNCASSCADEVFHLCD